MSGMKASPDQHLSSGSRKITPTRPLYDDYKSAFTNITPNRRSSQLRKMEAVEGIDLDDVNRGDFSSTRPPRIDLGQGSTQDRQPSIRKRAVGVLTRAFSNRQASAQRAAGIRDLEHAQELIEVYDEDFGVESEDDFEAYDAEFDGDDNEVHGKEPEIGSEHPDLDHLRTIQTTDRRSDPFDLETAYGNVLSGAISTPLHMSKLQTMNAMISQFRKDSESGDEEALAEPRPLPSRAVIQSAQQNTGNAPGGLLPSLPRPRRNRNYFAPGVATTSELTSDSYGETRNLLAMDPQSSQKRMSGMSRTSRLSVEDVLNLQSPLKRLTSYGRQVFAEGGEMDISVGDVRKKLKLNEREVSHALHQQVSNSGPSHSTGTGNHEGRVWFAQTSTTDSNELLNYLDGNQEEVEGSQHTEGFYNQQHIDATWVDAQDTNAVRVPIFYRPLSDHISSHVETEAHHEEVQYEEDQEIQPYENEWETVADTASMGNNNPFTNHNYRQAGSSVANTSDAGQDLDYVPQQEARLPSHEAVVQHPAINTYPHRYANRQIPGSERDMRIPQYMGHRVGTNNSLRTNPFSSPPPERLSVGPQVARGPITDFGRNPLTNSSATNGLTMSTEAATESLVPDALTSRNLITSSRILTGYDPGSNEGMWTEQQHMEQPQRLSIPPPIPTRSSLRGDHYVGSQNSLNTASTMNSWDYVNYAANNGNEETIPMVPLASPRPAYFGGNRRSQQNHQSELRRPPGAFYKHIRAAQPSHRSPKRHSSRPYELLPNSGSSSIMNSTRPGSHFHPKTKKPWPRIRSMPGPDGHHPSRSIINPNPSTNMGEFRFKNPIWEMQYTTQQMQHIRTNYQRRERQQPSVNANIPVSPPQLYSARRRQLISNPAVRSQQNKLSYIALICCIGLPGIGWLLFWYGTLDKFICSMTDGEIERFGNKQKRIALYLACLTGLITIAVLVYLIFAIVHHSLY